MIMRYIKKISLLVVLALASLVTLPAQAQSTGNCDAALGEAFLDVNNVRARILNNGNLFWRGSPHVYEVPKGGGANAIFASGIWLGGTVGGDLRIAASRYGPYEFWAGPLDDQGNPPSDCSGFDRVFKVSKEDVIAYEGSGVATPDLQDWPTGLGAPTLDAEGNEIDLTGLPLAQRLDRVINLAAGERPAILGDQMLWWVMNDRGNTHNATDSPPVGLEVHGSAFAFNTAGAIGNTTFYKYRIFYKGDVALNDAYFGIFSDPDLGNFDDDYIGSDTTLGLGYVYNADDDDEGGDGYGQAPPATGYDFFQGPLVANDGVDNDGDGTVDEEDERLAMTAFTFYNNGGCVTCDPTDGPEYMNYMQARWRDGQRFTFGGNGRDFSNIPTNYVFPGDPSQGEFWTEFNSDGQGTAIAPADRRFVMATGPFRIDPGDQQEIVFGVVWSRGDNNLDSVARLKADDVLAQQVFDIDFALPAPPAAPRVEATLYDGRVILTWGYNPTDNNYQESYRVIDPLLSSDVTDNDYVFEGYRVYRYANAQDQVGEVVATYDVINGITRVIEGDGLTFLTADGSDRGVQRSHEFGGLTNYETYYFGVQAYAYNAPSGQRVYDGPVRRITVVPAPNENIIPEATFAAAQTSGTADFVADIGGANVGNGSASADVINPAAITGDTYEVRFFRADDSNVGKRVVAIDEDARGTVKDGSQDLAASKSSVGPITYDIVNTTTGVKGFDGQVAFEATGAAAAEGEAVQVVDGLSFNIFGAPNGFLDFQAVSNAAGPLAEPDGASADWQGFPGLGRPSSGQQVGEGAWIIHTGDNGSRGPYDQFIARTVEGRGGWGNLVPYDFEWRFTERCLAAYNANVAQAGCLGWDAFGVRGFDVIPVPFELWRIGIATPDDASDDVRLIPYVIDWDVNGWGLQDFDHSGSSANNDPESDWVYFYLPADLTPGESGYNAWEAAALAWPVGGNGFPAPPSQGDFFGVESGGEIIGRIVVFNWNGGEIGGPYDQDLPEPGTSFRIVTTKPNQPGDAFAVSTVGFGAREQTQEEKVAALDNIGISPNPYKGHSAYEVSQLVDEVRFTGMPEQANISIFTINGTLIRTLTKNSASPLFTWDLQTQENLPIASGVYLIHVEVPGVGEKVIKFAVVKKRVQLNTF